MYRKEKIWKIIEKYWLLVLKDYHNIVEFKDGEYVFVHQLSEANVQAMRENMSDEDVKEFDKFLDTAWGW